MPVRWLANVARELLSANRPLLISKFGREGEEHQHAAKRFSPGKKKMNRVKCEYPPPPRVIPQVHVLTKYMYFSSPAFQLFFIRFLQAEKKGN